MMNQLSKLSAILALVAGAGWLTAATMIAPARAAPARAAEAPPVVASIPPVHSLLSGVMKGAGTPRLLMAGGRSPHSYALKPSDARALANARAVFWIGPALEGFLVKPLMALTGTVFTVELAGAEGVVTRPHSPGGGSGSGSGGGPDPHIWLDPANAAQMVKTMVIVLANIDPANAVLYRRNGSNVLAGLAALDGEIRQILAPVKDEPFMVFHDAYGHFERRFGLNGAGAVSVHPGRPPGARRLRALRRRIGEENIRCLFTEPQFQPALARTLIEGTEARLGVLDPLGTGAGVEPGPGLYGALMRGLARSFAGCLGSGSGGAGSGGG